MILVLIILFDHEQSLVCACTHAHTRFRHETGFCHEQIRTSYDQSNPVSLRRSRESAYYLHSGSTGKVKAFLWKTNQCQTNNFFSFIGFQLYNHVYHEIMFRSVRVDKHMRSFEYGLRSPWPCENALLLIYLRLKRRKMYSPETLKKRQKLHPSE